MSHSLLPQCIYIVYIIFSASFEFPICLFIIYILNLSVCYMLYLYVKLYLCVMYIYMSHLSNPACYTAKTVADRQSEHLIRCSFDFLSSDTLRRTYLGFWYSIL